MSKDDQDILERAAKIVRKMESGNDYHRKRARTIINALRAAEQRQDNVKAG
jgi:hypothetical protein